MFRRLWAMGSGVKSVLMEIRFMVLVASAGYSVAKRWQAFSMLRIPNFIICRIEGSAKCIHLVLLPLFNNQIDMACISPREDK